MKKTKLSKGRYLIERRKGSRYLVHHDKATPWGVAGYYWFLSEIVGKEPWVSTEWIGCYATMKEAVDTAELHSAFQSEINPWEVAAA